jgi:hypothetical protein
MPLETSYRSSKTDRDTVSRLISSDYTRGCYVFPTIKQQRVATSLKRKEAHTFFSKKKHRKSQQKRIHSRFIYCTLSNLRHCLPSRPGNPLRPPNRTPNRHLSTPLRPRISNTTIPPTLRLLLIIRALRHERRPIPNRRPIQQQNNRNNTQRQPNKPQQTRRPLEPQIRIQRLRSQRQESAETVAPQRSRRKRGSSVLFVSVREVVDDRHVNLVDAQADARDAEGRHDPVHGAVRRPAVPEHARREDQRPGDGEVQAGFWAGFTRTLLVCFRRAEVQHVLQRVDQCPDDGAGRERELDQTSLEGAEAVQFGEDLRDAALEEEQDPPRETDPEREGDDDEFGYEHFGRPLEGHFEHLGHAGLVELGFGEGVAALLAQALGAAGEDDIAAGFFQDEVEEGQQGCVCDELDLWREKVVLVSDSPRTSKPSRTYPINPPPTKMRLRRTPHKRPQRNPNNTRHAKDRHRQTPLPISFPDISQRPRHDINANRARPPSKKPRHNQRREIRRRGRRYQPNEEHDIAGEVPGHATYILG